MNEEIWNQEKFPDNCGRALPSDMNLETTNM